MALDEKTRFIQTATVVAEAIRDLGTIPSGVLYAHIMSLVDFDTYTRVIEILKRGGLVRETNYLLVYTGPPRQNN